MPTSSAVQSRSLPQRWLSSIGLSSTTTRTRTSPQAPSARRDRTTLSNESRPTRAQRRESAQSRVGRFFSGLGDGIESGAGSVSRGIQNVADFLGDRVGDATRLRGEVTGAVARGGSQLVAGALDLAGQDRASARVRSAGESASQFLRGAAASEGEMASSFVSGVGDGVGGLVEGIGTAVANPVQTAEGLGRLEQLVNPLATVREVARGRSLGEVVEENQQTVRGIVDGVREEYRQTGEDHGGAGQAGRAAFDILGTVLTGGSGAAGRVGLRATTNVLDDVARVSRATARGGEVADAGRVSSAAGSFLGRRANGPLAPVANRLTAAAERVSQAGVRRAERLQQRTLARGQQRTQGGDVPGADGARLLTSSRNRAGALSGDLRNNRAQWEAGGAQREELISSLPETTQRRVRELESAGRSEQALEMLQRSQVDGAIRSSLDDVGRIDEMYPAQLPPDVDPSRVLALGRRDSLEYMLRDTNLSADGLRRNFRHIVGDSDVTGPVYIQEFRAGDRVGRAFSSSAGRESGIRSRSRMEGGYFGSVDDARLSRSQIQARNALGLENHADRFATFSIPEDTYGVVSRIGEQFEQYGGHAVGGNVQITFPGAVSPVDPRVTNVGRVSSGTQRALNATAATGATGWFGQAGLPEQP